MKRFNVRYTSFVLVLVVLALPFIRNEASKQLSEALPHDFSQTTNSEADWLKIGRHEAEFSGLVGEPVQEDIAVMTYGSYAIMTRQNPNPVLMAREGLVVVYQVFGDIPTLSGFGSGNGSTHIGGFIFVYNAETGVNFEAATLPKDKSGALNFSFIPADTGELPSIDLTRMPTAFPVDDSEVPLPTQLPPESTAELLPLP
jgi:hypothetical protein